MSAKIVRMPVRLDDEDLASAETACRILRRATAGDSDRLLGSVGWKLGRLPLWDEGGPAVDMEQNCNV